MGNPVLGSQIRPCMAYPDDAWLHSYLLRKLLQEVGGEDQAECCLPGFPEGFSTQKICGATATVDGSDFPPKQPPFGWC